MLKRGQRVFVIKSECKQKLLLQRFENQNTVEKPGNQIHTYELVALQTHSVASYFP